MMNQRGFSLVELIVILAIIGTLLAIATLNWNEMNTKSGMESQIKKMYADLMEVRLQALYTKTPRSVVISNTQFMVYATADTTTAPIQTKVLRYPITWNKNGAITFDAQGLANGAERSMCIDPANENSAYVDSIVISAARINLGKRQTGAGCASGTIDQK
jgi:prepilin-type N-terminal cleavage/methylation domain-containing protein